MIRKSLYVGGATMLLLGLLFGADAASYVFTGVSRTREMVKNSVPIEFQLDRARQLVRNLDPEIRQNMHKIAKEEVAIEELARKQQSLETKLARSEKDLRQLNGDLQRGESTFVYSGKSYTGAQVKTDLESRFGRHKTMREMNDNLAKTIALRQQGLAAAQDKLREMQGARGQLEAEIAGLEARLEMVKVARTSTEVCCFDDSVLSRAKTLLQDIDMRIGVDEKLLGSEPAATGAIELESKSDRDISGEITEYFSDHETDADIAQRN